MSEAASPWRVTSDGLVLRVRLTPKSSNEAIGGIEATAEGPAIKARVRALPAEGEANAALERLIARWLDVPKSNVSLVGGAKSRVKSIAIRGVPDHLVESLQERAGPHPKDET